MSSKLQLDHVVLLLPYQDVINPPKWITDHFTLSEGGRHADGKTENKLVLFADGTYLELIAFIDDDPERRSGHWWDKPYGVIDFALTTTWDHSFGELPAIKDRLSYTASEISYTDPKDGGRIRPDGTELQWRVTFPTGTDRGTVPFFCHDVTPRERRVPITDSNTNHPSGAIGMAGVKLDVASSLSVHLTNATVAILDVDLSENGHFQLAVPHGVKGTKAPTIRLQDASPDEKKNLSLSLVLQSPKRVPDVQHRIGDGEISILFEAP